MSKITSRKISKSRAYAFIDASNLFYGGEKSLGWKIDYKKLLEYLKTKYQVSKVLYFGGVEIHGFKYDYLEHDTVPLRDLRIYLEKNVKENEHQHLQRIKFYAKLEKFGYELYLKPVKLYAQEDGTMRKKANCDVEMAFYLMKEQDDFDRALILSGDGDFLPVLKYLREQKKEIIILARGHRTAREIRQFAGDQFRDFTRLETALKFEEKP